MDYRMWMTVLLGVFAALLPAGAAQDAAASSQAQVESLGRPCRAKNILTGRLVTDPATGRQTLVLPNMNEVSGMELLFVDFENNTARVVRCPAGQGAWSLNEVPGRRLVVGTYYDGKYMVLDLERMRFVKTVAFPGEEYIWNSCMGSDGRLYGGTYPGGKLGALDLKTYTLQDCGAGAPPNLYLRYVSALPDGRILCCFTTSNPAVKIYDPASRRFEDAPEELTAAVKGMRGVSWQGTFFAGTAAFDGKTLQRVPYPFPTPDTGNGLWWINSTLTSDKQLFFAHGNTVWRYVPGEKQPQKITETPLRGADYLAAASDGRLLGVRGQDYFVIRPGESEMTLRRIPGEDSPRSVMFLRVDPQGRVWGGPTFGQTVFWLDPRTRKYENTATVCDGNGEVYDAAFLDGKAYFASYAGGNIICYNPSAPWDQWNGRNPVTIVSLASRGYIRPVAGIHAGPDGKLYSGWLAQYGVYGGAVSITDPATGATDLIENPLGNQGIGCMAVGADYVCAGTTLYANGLPVRTGEKVSFGMIDLASRQVVFRQEFAESIGSCVLEPVSNVVVLAVGKRIMLFSPKLQRFLAPLPADTPEWTGADLAAPGDGKVYYSSGRSIVALNLKTGRAQTVAADLPGISHLAASPDGWLVFSIGADVYRVRIPKG